MERKNHNSFSVFLGILCIIVVYLHSSWIDGFNIFSLGLSSSSLNKISGLLLMTAVPSFFFVWGILSNKYLHQDIEKISFWRGKIYQFYPLYLISFLLHQIINFTKISNFSFYELFGGVVGVYYTAGFHGGNIYVPVFFIVLTLPFLKSNRFPQKNINCIFMCLCLLLAKFLPHESSLCYFRYFGYYTAFFVGIFLQDIDILSRVKQDRQFVSILACIALLTPVLNFMGVFTTEIEYSPNSPEQILLSVFISCLCLVFLDYVLINNGQSYFLYFLSDIGNNAYFHFMIHVFVIHGLSATLLSANFSLFFIQVAVILFTSIICIKFVLPIYKKISYFLCHLMYKI